MTPDPSSQPLTSRAAIVGMLAAAMIGPDPAIVAVNLTNPGAAVLTDREGRSRRLTYRRGTVMAKTG